MNGGRQIDAYLQTIRREVPAEDARLEAESKRLARIRTHVQESTEYFAGKGITAPTAEDLAEWKVSLRATRSEKTASDWVRDARNYYGWQKGQNSTMTQADGTEDMSEVESGHEEADKVQNSDISASLHSESINESDTDGQVQNSDIQALPHSESVNDEAEHHEDADTPEASIATFEHSDIATLQKPKRGRRPDPEKAGRVAVSVYLPRETYEAIKDLAAYNELGVSDLLADIASITVKRNADVIARAREALARIREIKRQELRFEL